MTIGTISPSSALALVEDALTAGLSLRLFGSLAIWYRCPAGRTRFERLRERPIKDIDLVGLFAQKRPVEQFLQQRGWVLDEEVARIPGVKFSLVYLIDRGRVWSRCDVHYNALDFCHTIDLRTRLLVDDVTIPLAELVLSKLQVGVMTSVDDFDITTVLLEHDVQPADGECVNSSVVASRCGADWGLHTTALGNVRRLRVTVATDAQLTQSERAILDRRLHDLEASIHRGRKTFRWWLRRLVGRRMRWQDEVDPVGLAVGDLCKG